MVPCLGKCQSTRWTEREAAVRAAVVFNVLRYTRFENLQSEEIQFCIVGRNPFRDKLMDLSGKKIHGKTFLVKKIASINAELRICSALFLHRDLYNKMDELLNILEGSEVLLFGEGKRFLELGGMVNLISTGKNISFEINTSKADSSKIHFSSHLLRLAKRII